MQNQFQPTMLTGTTEPFNLGHPTDDGQVPRSQHRFPFSLKDSMQPDRYKFQEKLYNLPAGDLGIVTPLTSLLNQLGHSGQLPALALNFTTLLINLALPFWHALLVSTPVVYPSEAYPAPKGTLTDAEKWETLRKLEDLANALTIIFDELAEYDLGATWTTKRTLVTMPGRGAHIVLNQEFLNRINATTEAEDPIAFQILCLRIATTIVHELAHAGALANSGMPYPNPNAFIGDSKSNEIGFEIEKYLFGGIFDLDSFGLKNSNGWYYAHNNVPSGINYRLLMIDWPNNDMVNHYAERNADCACMAKLPPGGIYWTISFLHISRLFQKSYWDFAVSQLGRFALHFPRNLGELRTDDSTWNPQDLLQALMPGQPYVIDKYLRVYFVQNIDDPSAQKLREYWDQMPKNSNFENWNALAQHDFGMDPDLKVAMERVLATMDFDKTTGVVPIAAKEEELTSLGESEK
ncbi:hypothetical protein HII31_11210 [Pseudocercospora fuligena]|uniref:Uncharacterized protein n=1 Tax=Pseudocercospora fuligena TaxID=685502 RepID=A0A8H6R8W7_9PEZI|nr:hypothetical protein HII31_11210 [Pseudocercospora fuligena]